MLTPTYYPITGGAEKAIKNTTVRQNRMGIKTDIMTLCMDTLWDPKWKWQSYQEDEYTVYRIPGFRPIHGVWDPLNIILDVKAIPHMGFKKIANEYDILHIHNDTDLTFPLFLRPIKKPKLFWCHTMDVSFKWINRIYPRKHILKNSADIFVCSSKQTAAYTKMLGIPEEKIKVIHYGVDVDKYVPDDAAKEDDLVLWASRIDPIKGLHILLKSLKYIDRPIHLAISGLRSNDFPAYNREINKLIEDEMKAGKHRITFLQSVVGDDLIPWYQRASLFAIPYPASPVFPLVNLEALACGTPVVSTRVGGVSELITDEYNGLLVPPNDPEELSKAIQRMLEDGELRKRCGRNGRAMVEHMFSWAKVSRQLSDIYDQMMSGN